MRPWNGCPPSGDHYKDEIKLRKDVRRVLTFTIDPADAKI